MRAKIVVSGILFAAFAGQAMANCTSDPLVGGNLTNLISNSLICARPGADYTGNASDRWQEQHRADNTIWDYKLGVGNAFDGEKQVGTWSTTNGSSATYTENNGSPATTYSYRLRQIGGSGNNYSFCVGSAEMVRATINAGLGSSGNGCASYPP